MKKYFIFIFSVILLVGCNSNSKKDAVPEEDTTTENADSVQLIQNYDSLVVTEAKAAVDSTFAQSDEYKASHEAYEKMLSRMTEGLDETDAALLQLQMEAASLQSNGSYFSSNVELMRDPVNQKRMQITAQKAMDLGKKIEGMGLSPEQKVLFDSLKTIIHI